MKFKISKKVKSAIKAIFILGVLGIVIKEFSGIVTKFNGDSFSRYADKLTFVNTTIIVCLGLVAFIPLTIYDLVLKNNMSIKLKPKKVYKYSWIASSISSIVGFGGTSAIALKTHFYGKHVKDKTVLVKKISKNVLLNLTGFSMLCFVYTIFNINEIKEITLMKVIIVVIGMCLPALIIYMIFHYFKYKNSEEIIYTLKIISISLIEWIATVGLIYGILAVLKCNVTIFELFPVFVSAVVVATVSMVPGGIGTFDLTLLLGLEKYNVPAEKVLLAIVLYRLTYYIIPLIIGLVMYIHESYTNLNQKFENTEESVI